MRLQAIANIYKNAITVDETNGAFDKDGKQIEINEILVTAEIERLENEWNVNLYQLKRKQEYPSIGDQLDMLWHAIDSNTLNKTSDFYKTLKAVKDANPKA